MINVRITQLRSRTDFYNFVVTTQRSCIKISIKIEQFHRSKEKRRKQGKKCILEMSLRDDYAVNIIKRCANQSNTEGRLPNEPEPEKLPSNINLK